MNINWHDFWTTAAQIYGHLAGACFITSIIVIFAICLTYFLGAVIPSKRNFFFNLAKYQFKLLIILVVIVIVSMFIPTLMTPL